MENYEPSLVKEDTIISAVAIVTYTHASVWIVYQAENKTAKRESFFSSIKIILSDIFVVF